MFESLSTITVSSAYFGLFVVNNGWEHMKYTKHI